MVERGWGEETMSTKDFFSNRTLLTKEPFEPALFCLRPARLTIQPSAPLLPLSVATSRRDSGLSVKKKAKSLAHVQLQGHVFFGGLTVILNSLVPELTRQSRLARSNGQIVR